jgi:hypothetical protein
MTELEQFAALRLWLLGFTGLPEIIRAHPDGPRPRGVYGMLNLIRLERVNWPDDIEYEDAADPGSDDLPMLQVPVETWEAVWSFNIYGPNGAAILARTASAARSSAALLQLAPMVLHRTSGVRRLPELVENAWEDRSQADLFVHYRTRHGFGADEAEAATFATADAGDAS